MKFILQLFFIWLIYAVSDLVVSFLDLPIPASVFGMILLFLMLVSGVVKVQYIEKATTFLNKHLSFFFIPFAVGLMNYGGLIKASGVQLLIMIIVSSAIGLLMTSGLTQFLARRVASKHEHKHEQSNFH
ncbi:CidA/LrgA family protein [Schinkia azotoformans]|uniref:CidA/LrgA family protein n=1 Tax=Schinkia azotoformans TaxID=1454 RepID=UPI002DB566B4|nr:CidA/LrgA family protein [Schinkia azotoformans]MEC1698246.1 CidA/LrgA family protein [Schinkia azotoformans]MEC1716475.1 CidA/LrgA family protein [Schinkia azotoformans]MEC1758788.1 CidA/LrgA family protein [Schinkia azotoformans]